MAETAPGKLIIVSGPSGAGKTTLLKRMYEECGVALIAGVSATTRAPRPGEIDGIDYHFVSQDEFERLRQAGNFLECFEVFGRGDWYGTLRNEVAPRLTAGKWVVLEIDVQGTLAVLEHYPDAVTIFIEPRSVEELERRLRLRGTETEAALERRLETARRELAQAHLYRHRVMNDDLDLAVVELCEILKQNGGDS
jgi:guanylate kinase